MKPAKITPIVNTKKLNVLKEFYLRHFDFEVTFDSPEYLGFKAHCGAEVAFMVPHGPREAEYSGEGVILAIEVADVDTEHERVRDSGLEIARALQDNPWGDRSFTVLDPVGVSLYVYEAIPPSAEFAQYAKE